MGDGAIDVGPGSKTWPQASVDIRKPLKALAMRGRSWKLWRWWPRQKIVQDSCLETSFQSWVQQHTPINPGIWENEVGRFHGPKSLTGLNNIMIKNT
jgi:hypothetical protein